MVKTTNQIGIQPVSHGMKKLSNFGGFILCLVLVGKNDDRQIWGTIRRPAIQNVVPGGSQNVFVARVFKHPVLWIKDFGLLFLRLDKLTAMENYHL